MMMKVATNGTPVTMYVCNDQDILCIVQGM